MKTKIIFLGILIIVLGSTLSNCSKDKEDEKDKIKEEPNYVGSWEGTTSANQKIYFRVNSNNQIDTLKMYVIVNLISGTCTGLYLYKTTKLTPTTIYDDGSFEIELEGAQMTFNGDSKAKLTGKFSSNLNSAGKFNNMSVYAILCGTSYTVGIGPEIPSFTWSANKK